MRGVRVRVGDRVSWMGGVDFGTREVQCFGTVVSTGCGVPYYWNPPRYTHDGYALEAGRKPAVAVRPDGHEPTDTFVIADDQLIPHVLRPEPRWSDYPWS